MRFWPLAFPKLSRPVTRGRFLLPCDLPVSTVAVVFRVGSLLAVAIGTPVWSRGCASAGQCQEIASGSSSCSDPTTSFGIDQTTTCTYCCNGQLCNSANPPTAAGNRVAMNPIALSISVASVVWFLV